MNRIIRRILFLCIIIMLIFAGAYATEAVPNKEFSSWDPAPEVTPPSNKHPRVLFTEEDIPEIKENMTLKENAYAFEALEDYLSREITVPTGEIGYDETALSIIEAHAFYYAIFKDDAELSDEALAAGREAVLGLERIDYINPGNAIDFCRRWGRMMNVAALVYDWCYDLLSDEQKIEVPNRFREYGMNFELWVTPSGEEAINGNPSGQGVITGHGSEAQLLRDMLSFAIAVYDERPDIWNYVGGRYYDEYVPARAFWSPSHYTHQGTDYGFYRRVYDDYAFMLITGMGAQDPYEREDISKSGYSELYFKRPDGALFRDGDIYSSTTPPYSYQGGSADAILMEYAMTGDACLKQELMKRSFSKIENGITFNMSASPVLFLIYNKPDIQAKTFHNMPYSKYFASPSGIMAARTGWDEGENSPAVAAVMKIGEYDFNNHQHLDHGHFQLYYKGLLAADSGNYNWYADAEHAMYTSKTVAHNCMLVFDPEEYKDAESGAPTNDHRYSPSADTWVYRRESVNDGGQTPAYSYNEIGNLDTFLSKDMKTTSVLAREIDPENSQKPYYTYIKGDLTGAYSDKVSDYSRSFMFLDLKSEEIPAALIVFDEITSADAKFKKTWLLHGTEEPAVNENKAVFENTAEGSITSYGGRLELTALLPKADNLSTDIVGGSEEGWGVVRRWKYNGELSDWEMTFQQSYDEENASEEDENNTYRLEISPKAPAEKDYFFNVMLVSDAGEPTGVTAELIEAGAFYGTTVLDRAVFFALDGEENTEFEAGLSGTYRYTVCDMKPGTYKVTDDSGEKAVCVSDEGHILSFVASGSVSAVRQSDTYTAPADKEHEASEAVYIKLGSEFVSLGDGVSLAGEDSEIELEACAKALGYTVEAFGSTFKVKNGAETVATVLTDSGTILTQRGIRKLEGGITAENGSCRLRLSDIYNVLIGNGEYQSFANTVYASRLNNVIKPYYAVGYLSGEEIIVNAKLLYPLSATMYCGVYKDDCLVAVKRLEENAEGHFSASFDGSAAEGGEFKIFSWGEELLPFGEKRTLKGLESEKYEKIYTSENDGLKITKTAGLELTSNGEVQTFTKTGTQSEVNAYLSVSDKYYLGESRFIHYSTIVKNISSSGIGENIQFRVRGNTDNQENTASIISMFLLEAAPSLEYKLDCIVDLEKKQVCLYIDEELYKTNDISGWQETYGGNINISGFHHYFTASAGISGGAFSLYDPYIAVYPGGTSCEEIMSGAGNILFK